MDIPTYEHFPSQSWESWQGIEDADTENMDPSDERDISFDADAVVRQAVAQRGTASERQALGIEA